jgi:MFS family permease
MRKFFTLLSQVFPSVLYYVIYCLSRFSENETNVILRNVMNFSDMDVSTLSFFFSAGYAFFQIPIGFLQDKFSQKKISSFLLLINCLGNFLFLISDNFYLLCISKFMIGFGCSMAAVGLWSFLQKHIPSKFVIVSSISTAIGLLFTILLPRIITLSFNGGITITSLFTTQLIISVITLLIMFLFSKDDTVYYTNKDITNEKSIKISKHLFFFMILATNIIIIYFICKYFNIQRSIIAINIFTTTSVLFYIISQQFEVFREVKKSIVKELKILFKPIPILFLINICMLVASFYSFNSGKIEIYTVTSNIHPSYFFTTVIESIRRVFSSGYFFYIQIISSIILIFLSFKRFSLEIFFFFFILFMGKNISLMLPGVFLIRISYCYSGFLMPIIKKKLPGILPLVVFSFLNCLFLFLSFVYPQDNYGILWVYTALLGLISKMQVITAEHWKNLFDTDNYNGVFSILNFAIASFGAALLPFLSTFIMETVYGSNAINNPLVNKYYFLIQFIFSLIGFISILIISVKMYKKNSIIKK